MRDPNRIHGRSFTDRYPGIFKTEGSTKTVTFIVTHQCNLRCSYCYEHNKSDKRMSFETAKKCVDILFEEDVKQSVIINSKDAECLILDFIGGEPLLEIDLIDQIIKYFLDKAIELNHRWATRYMITMSTNGVLGADPKVDAFMRRYDGRLSMGVTIDGDKEAHDACRKDCNGCGSYDKAIELFRRTSGPTGHRVTKYTIAPGNINHLAKAIEHLVFTEECSIVNCNCVYEEGWTIEHAKVLYDQLKLVSQMLRTRGSKAYISILDWEAGSVLNDNDTQNWCGGDGRMLAFDVDGTILPCLRYSAMAIDPKKQPLYRIGDVDNGLLVLQEDIDRFNILRGITRQSQSSQECLDCSINRGCAWCTAYNYEVTGTPDKRVTYICCMHKARVLAQCYHHNMMRIEDGVHVPKKMRIPKEWALEIISEEEYDMLLNIERQACADLTDVV